jgi:large subunit ribosomal protein L4
MARKEKKTLSEGTIAHTLTLQDVGIDNAPEMEGSTEAFSQYVRAIRQNRRQGTVACKDRSKVTSRSNKKPWKQKGTGRARHGSPRSPLWRGGGVIFGPQPRTRTVSIAKSMKRNVLNTVFMSKVNEGNVIVLDFEPSWSAPKTSEMHKVLRNAGLHDSRVLFFVQAHDSLIHASLSNIPSVDLLLFDQPNAYDLALRQKWVIFKKDIEAFKKMVSSWI